VPRFPTARKVLVDSLGICNLLRSHLFERKAVTVTKGEMHTLQIAVITHLPPATAQHGAVVCRKRRAAMRFCRRRRRSKQRHSVVLSSCFSLRPATKPARAQINVKTIHDAASKGFGDSEAPIVQPSLTEMRVGTRPKRRRSPHYSAGLRRSLPPFLGLDRPPPALGE
jgi:hypothetical protein